MHELSICQALMAEVGRLAREQRARRVVSVTVRIGPLSGTEPALLAGAFPLASAGTAAAGSRLIIERAQVRVQCLECGAQSPATATRLVCGSCGDWRVRVLSGEELLLTRVELERDDD
jgi:hydrogenase nickel incorporation protein HypA/HybF